MVYQSLVLLASSVVGKMLFVGTVSLDLHVVLSCWYYMGGFLFPYLLALRFGRFMALLVVQVVGCLFKGPPGAEVEY